MKKRRSERANDFYFLSFDNELSDTAGSSSSSTDTDTKVPTEVAPQQTLKLDDIDYDDAEDLTATSISSSITLNNESTSCSSTHNPEDSETINPEYRQQLIEYLFSNEENKNSFLNGNLNSFLNALDSFFTNSAHEKFSLPDKNSDLNSVCEQILTIYNELFSLQANSIESLTFSKYNGDVESEQIEQNDKITHFPMYINSSSIDPSLSGNVAIDKQFQNAGTNEDVNGIENDNYSNNGGSNEADLIGPFLVALFGRLDHMLSNSLQINFLLTGILARLAYYPQLLLRSFLLNHNLVVQSNVKTLIQVLGNLRFKIDACSQTFNNFPLLYFRAKVCLVKRIVDVKTNNTIPIRINQLPKVRDEQIGKTPETSAPRKKSTLDRFINFFKPEEDKSQIDSSKKSEPSSNEPCAKDTKPANFEMIKNSNDETQTPKVEIDLNDSRMMFTKNNIPAETFAPIELVGDYAILENEWEKLQSRNIALSAVIFDEFIKELAAICQEHGLSIEY